MALPAGVNSKFILRLQQVARYRTTGRLQDKQIAFLVGLTLPELQKVLATPEYAEIEAALMEGSLSQLDEQLAADVDGMKDHFRAAVPAAMRTLMEATQQRKDLKSALMAAKEILDRDPDHVFTTQKAAAPIPALSATQGTNPNAFNPGANCEVLAQITIDGAKVTAELRSQPRNLSSTVDSMANNGAAKKPEEIIEGEG